jgi:DNA-binding GntR family transcriptional regulator
MCRDKHGAEIEGMANQWLSQIETHPVGKILSPDNINDSLLYLQTGAYHNCPLRGSTQQVTGTDAHRCTAAKYKVETGESCGKAERTVYPQEDQQSQLT